MQLHLLDLLVLISLSQGIVFGLVLLFGRFFKSRTNRFLAFSIMMIAFIGLDAWLSSRNFDEHYYFIDFFGDDVPWMLLFYVPLLVYFLKSVEHPLANSQKLWLLTTPFFVFFLLNIIIDLDTDFGWINAPFFVEKREKIFAAEYFFALFYSIFLAVISYWIILKSTLLDVNEKWLKRIWYFVSFLQLLWLMLTFLPNSLFDQHPNVDNYFWISISLFIYWLSYKGLYQFNLAKDQFAIQQIIQHQTTDYTPVISEQISKNTKLSTPDNAYFSKFIILMEQQKLYQNPDLSRDVIAEELGISAGYLSQLLSAYSDQNFTSFVNNYRVESIKKMLLDPKFDQYSLLAIGMEAGFKSKSAFYESFKKITGMTPNQFKNQS